MQLFEPVSYRITFNPSKDHWNPRAHREDNIRFARH